MVEKDLIEAISSLKSSLYKRRISEAIGDKIMLPSEVAMKTDIRLNHLSTILKTLKSSGIVECLNEEKKRGRLYRLTGLGKNAKTKSINVLYRG